MFAIAHDQSICLFDEHSFEKISEWYIPAQHPDQEILYITVSKDDKKIALAVGERVIKDAKEV